MELIAFELRRTALVGFTDDAALITTAVNRGREDQRLARRHLLGLANVRNDVLAGLLDASAHTRQRQRRAHYLEERAPARLIIPFAGGDGEFALHALAEF